LIRDGKHDGPGGVDASGRQSFGLATDAVDGLTSRYAILEWMYNRQKEMVNPSYDARAHVAQKAQSETMNSSETVQDSG
jgi:hypothetical protein